MNIRRLLGLLGQTLLGLAILIYCGDAFHDEMVRPERSLALLGGLGAGILLGALIVPGAGDKIAAAAKRGIDLGKYGRRAYDAPPPP